MKVLDVELIRHTLQNAQRNAFSEVELRIGDDRFRAKLSPHQVTPQPESIAIPEPSEVNVTSPIVGYYRAEPMSLEVGLNVQEGQAIGAITALGLANDVISPATGTISEVAVEEGQPVEFGQVLARVKPL